MGKNDGGAAASYPCRTCRAEAPVGIKLPPAEYIADAGSTDRRLPWPICEAHAPLSIIAGWKLYDWNEPEALPLVAMLAAREETGNG